MSLRRLHYRYPPRSRWDNYPAPVLLIDVPGRFFFVQLFDCSGRRYRWRGTFMVAAALPAGPLRRGRFRGSAPYSLDRDLLVCGRRVDLSLRRIQLEPGGSGLRVPKGANR